MRKLNYEKVTYHLITYIRKYFKKAGFDSALIGLSGGIDSAVVASLAMLALGSNNVKAIFMPSAVSSTLSEACAREYATAADIVLETHSILEHVHYMAVDLSVYSESSIAFQNIQARIRGVILMTIANKEHRLVLATGNKSENMLGYCTLYGDTVGAFEIIGDLYKTEVYELAKYLKSIPQKIIDRKPTAELADGQFDEKDLLPYPILDKLLYLMETTDNTVTQLARKSVTSVDNVEKILKLAHSAEFKHKQTAPTVKLSKGCFK
jgi:NAD+ synthetase